MSPDSPGIVPDRERAARAAALAVRFRDLFGETPRIYRAPGRVNLIGEHTDYNDGLVMPVALDLACWLAAAPRSDRALVVQSENLGERVAIDLSGDGPAPTGDWRDYVAGVAVALRARGCAIGGATLLVESDVPAGAGLSSSAALEVAAGAALVDLAGIRLDPTSLAVLCQRAENEFVGAPCGIMDQYVACHGRAGRALMLDCRSLEHRLLPLPSQIRIIACNTMIRHTIAGGEYRRRRAECEEAVAQLAQLAPGMRSLRDLGRPLLDASRRDLADPLFRRCRHVVSENERVGRMAEALEASDLGALGGVMFESHRSLRDDYEVSCDELDALVDLAGEMPGVFGSRMTGGGFGGCTVNLVHADAVPEFSRRVPPLYEARFGVRPDVYVSESADAVERIDV